MDAAEISSAVNIRFRTLIYWFGRADLGPLLLQNRPKSSRCPKQGVWRGFCTRKVYHRDSRFRYSFGGAESGSEHSVRQAEGANAILRVRDLRREQIVWIGGLASR